MLETHRMSFEFFFFNIKFNIFHLLIPFNMVNTSFSYKG